MPRYGNQPPDARDHDQIGQKAKSVTVSDGAKTNRRVAISRHREGHADPQICSHNTQNAGAKSTEGVLLRCWRHDESEPCLCSDYACSESTKIFTDRDHAGPELEDLAEAIRKPGTNDLAHDREDRYGLRIERKREQA